MRSRSINVTKNSVSENSKNMYQIIANMVRNCTLSTSEWN